jgi:tetratricopeptide (TPR) repeat protein
MIRFFLSRRVLVSCGTVLCASLILGGCSQQQGTSEGSSITSLLASAGRSIGAARAYDRATRRLEEAMSANDTGYVLADAARNKRELRLSERLTRQALSGCEAALRDVTRPELQKYVPDYQFSCATVRDSFAWALYRQRRYQEAVREQERAVADMTAVGPLMGKARQSAVNRTQAELRYHLGEIYRALGRRDDARQQFKTAQETVPKHSDVAAALRALERDQLRRTPSLSSDSI